MDEASTITLPLSTFNTGVLDEDEFAIVIELLIVCFPNADSEQVALLTTKLPTVTEQVAVFPVNVAVTFFAADIVTVH
ncbi:hypothetical protein [Candidatus Magnetobacterium casense]|uniref:hypothetical protein n=1 Tax=Candidatus Magnetobacterium casense TaxID=1455061 RepID=UPI00058F4A1C|nr:hypothetical protein [Candidatus Magnetobacterium casensis]